MAAAGVGLALFAPEGQGGRPTVYVSLERGEAAEDEVAGTEPGFAVANEVLVRFQPEVARRGAPAGPGWGEGIRWLRPRRGRGLAGPAGGSLFDQFAVVTLPKGSDPIEAASELSRRPEVAYAEPNLRLGVAVEDRAGPSATPPTDFEFARQWALHNTGQTGGQPGADVHALEAWSITTGSSNVVVAIIDTGLDYYHPDLEPNVWWNPGEIPGNGVDDDANGYIDDVHGFDWVSDDGDPMDDSLHGTHVAGILGAVGNDENGIAGLAWSVRLMALKAFDETGYGTLDDTITAIGYAVASGARIINASWGTTVRSRALEEATLAAVEAGVVFVAAAGNQGTEIGFYPAAVSASIAVGATDASDRSPNFSNYGPFVDLVAPGDAIQSTVPNANWSALSGTSMAAPHVSGVAALLLSRRAAFRPDEIRTILRSTADPLNTGRFTGAGRLNAGAAVRLSEPLPDAGWEEASTLSGTVDLRGTAAGHGFAGFQVEWGAGRNPEGWQLLGGGGVPVISGTLVPAFDTTAFDDGDYTLRLTVTNAQGDRAMERASVVVRNVQLLNPRNNDIARQGDVLELLGTVAGEGWTFDLTWGIGPTPNEWRTDGMEVARGGVPPVIADVLGRWDSRVAPANAFVTVRLAARREGRLVGESIARMVQLEPRLREGWPHHLPFEEEFPAGDWREFNVADLEGDGSQEVVFVDHGEPGGRSPRLVVLGTEGAERWSRLLPGGAPEYDAPVIGDVDGDGRAEVFVDTGGGGEIAAFDADGVPLDGAWPVTPGGTHFGKALADLNADGRLELIALSSPPPDLVGNRARTLVVLDAEGTVLRRWTLGGCDVDEDVPERLPAVANLDDDPQLEIVAVDGCVGVSAFKMDQPEGPIWTALAEADLMASPVAGDLDGDGLDEVIIGGVRREAGFPGGVHVFQADGTTRPGWPALSNESFEFGAAMGDLDGDGALDIVIASSEADTVHALRHDGFELSGWPLPKQVNATTRSVPVLGDVDGDGLPDVVLPTGGHWLQVVRFGDTARSGGIRAWRMDGSPIDFQPGLPPDGLVMETGGGNPGRLFPPAALVDLDGNGFLDLIAATRQDAAISATAPFTTAKMRSSLYAWELPVRLSAESFPWPAFQGGPTRSGRYYRPPPANQAPRLLRLPGETVDLGIPFRPIALDRYVRDPDDVLGDLTWDVRGARDLRVTIDGQRVLVVAPEQPDWQGRETIEVFVRDPAGAEANTSVTFSVLQGYRPPLAVADLGSTLEDSPVTLNLLGNDTSPQGRPLRIGGLSRPDFGEVELLPDGGVRYVPAADFNGEDGFEYTVTDGDGGTATGEVRVQVAGVNDPPVAEADHVMVDEDHHVDFAPLENDHDVDGDPLTLVRMGAPADGTLEALDGNRFRFTPRADFSGSLTVPYEIRDPSGAPAAGEVVILVRPVNDPPWLQDQTITLNRNRLTDVFYDAHDADGDTLSFKVLEPPEHGVLLAYPTIASYEPNRGFTGTDRFTYSASDGLTTAGPATVTLVVEGVNNAPDVSRVSTVTAVDQTLAIGLTARDVDEEPVTLRIERAPDHGRVELVGTNAVYTPDAGYVGTDSFSYTATDGTVRSEVAEVTVRVTDQNTPPNAVSEVLTVPRNQPSTLRLRASDAENNPLSFLVVTNPAFGRLEGQAPEVTYVPRSNFRGLDHFDFVVQDRESTSSVATIHLLVRDPNRVPVVTNQTLRVERDRPGSVHLEAVDDDGDLLRAAILKGPKSGLVFGGGLDFTYQPRAGFAGRDSFTYKVWDGLAYSPVATVSVIVERPEEVQLEIVGVRVLAEGLELTIRAGEGRDVFLESSEDLVDWAPVGSVPNPTGIVRWVDPGWDARSQRFYRVAF